MYAQLRKAAFVAVAFFLLLLVGCGGGTGGNNQAGNPGTPNPGGNNNGGGNGGGGGTGSSTPSSKFLYVVGGERGADTLFIQTFTINPDSGVLTPLPDLFKAPEIGFSLVRSPLDFSFYSSSVFRPGIAGFVPGSTGQPQLVSHQGQDSGFPSVSPDGKFVINSTRNGIHVYSASQGSLSEISGSPLILPQRSLLTLVPGAGGRFYFAVGQDRDATPGSGQPDSRIHISACRRMAL